MFFMLGGFGVGYFVGAVLKERDGGTAALMDDLHSAGLRIDLAYLLGVAVFDADHVYLLSQNEKEKAGTFIHRRYCLMNARAGLNSNGSARLERY